MRYPAILLALLLLVPGLAAAEPPDSTLVLRQYAMYVRIDLDRNELAFMSGDHALWTAPVGTGTGTTLTAGQESWDFDTPRGTFSVLYKELDPVWIRPDWYYHEKGLPVPEKVAERKAPGELGAAAIYFAPELAIHGTSRPELLGQNVSHGCIRLLNADVMRLYHNVRPGTPVVIVGEGPARAGAGAPPPKAAAWRTGTFYSPGRQAPGDSATSTPELVARFDREREASALSADWTLTAGELVERGARGDTLAQRALLERGSGRGEWAYDREISAFLSGLYFRRPADVLRALGELEEPKRTDVAFALVRATLDLYPGSLSSRLTPWPSQAMPGLRARPELRTALQAIDAAEERYRMLFPEGQTAAK